MPQASRTQGLHSVFEKSVSLADDKGAFTVGKGVGGVGATRQAPDRLCSQFSFSTISRVELVPGQLKACGDTRRHR